MIETEPLPLLDRLKSAVGVLTTGKLPNPMASEPKDKNEAAQVAEMNKWCLDTRKFWKPIFDRIQDEQRFSAGKQWPKDYKPKIDDGMVEGYIGDVMQQMINRKTSTLFSKNPTPEARQRETLAFAIWDGDQASIDGAKALVAAMAPVMEQAKQAMLQGVAVPPPPPELAQAQALLKDYEQGIMRKAMLDRIAKTATLLLKSCWEQHTPDFGVCMKQLTTRVITSRVAFIKVMYRREDEPSPVPNGVLNLADKIQQLQAHIAMLQEPGFDPDSPEAKEAEQLLTTMQDDLANPDQAIVSDEGVVYDFPHATSILVDKNCTCLHEFIGAKRIAHEVLMTCEEVETKYQISLRDAGAVLYSDDGVAQDKERSRMKPNGETDDDTGEPQKICVWQIQDKETGMCYDVADGIKNFLRAPYENEPKVRRFWSVVPLVFNRQEVAFNDPEADVTIYPRSDVRLAMPMQIDINRGGEGRREHRVANRPCWIGVKARFAENDLQKLAAPRAAHTVLMLESLNPGEKIPDFIQPLPMAPISEELYSPQPSMYALQLATGIQSADLGQQRPDEKATGQQIAAQQKASTDGSNIEDLDAALSLVAQMTWEMLIQEMPAATVKKLVGPGAVWPDMARERLEAMNEISLAIEAGSSGRPNQAADVQNFGLIAPQLGQLMQAEGRSMEPLIKEGVRRLGDKLQVDDFLKPSQFAAPKQDAQAPAPPANKGPSISFKAADLTPDERAQALAQDGIRANPHGLALPQQPNQPAGMQLAPTANNPANPV